MAKLFATIVSYLPRRFLCACSSGGSELHWGLGFREFQLNNAIFQSSVFEHQQVSWLIHHLQRFFHGMFSTRVKPK